MKGALLTALAIQTGMHRANSIETGRLIDAALRLAVVRLQRTSIVRLAKTSDLRLKASDRGLVRTSSRRRVPSNHGAIRNA